MAFLYCGVHVNFFNIGKGLTCKGDGTFVLYKDSTNSIFAGIGIDDH